MPDYVRSRFEKTTEEARVAAYLSTQFVASQACKEFPEYHEAVSRQTEKMNNLALYKDYKILDKLYLDYRIIDGSNFASYTNFYEKQLTSANTLCAVNRMDKTFWTEWPQTRINPSSGAINLDQFEKEVWDMVFPGNSEATQFYETVFRLLFASKKIVKKDNADICKTRDRHVKQYQKLRKWLNKRCENSRWQKTQFCNPFRSRR